jgi:hypothetical protein
MCFLKSKNKNNEKTKRVEVKVKVIFLIIYIVLLSPSTNLMLFSSISIQFEKKLWLTLKRMQNLKLAKKHVFHIAAILKVKLKSSTVLKKIR